MNTQAQANLSKILKVCSSQGSRFWGQLYKYDSKINQDFEKCRIIRNKCLKKILLLQNEIVKGFDLRLNNSIRLSRLSLENYSNILLDNIFI